MGRSSEPLGASTMATSGETSSLSLSLSLLCVYKKVVSRLVGRQGETILAYCRCGEVRVVKCDSGGSVGFTG
ncbi:hypothetical protein IRJ41_022165, partial [Triplophysa rosa]